MNPELVEMLKGGMYLLLLVLGFLLARTLKKIDANQARLHERLDTLTEKFYVLQGEHTARREAVQCFFQNGMVPK